MIYEKQMIVGYNMQKIFTKQKYSIKLFHIYSFNLEVMYILMYIFFFIENITALIS